MNCSDSCAAYPECASSCAGSAISVAETLPLWLAVGALLCLSGMFSGLTLGLLSLSLADSTTFPITAKLTCKSRSTCFWPVRKLRFRHSNGR